jgi:hypothetical protein
MYRRYEIEASSNKLASLGCAKVELETQFSIHPVYHTPPLTRLNQEELLKLQTSKSRAAVTT